MANHKSAKKRIRQTIVRTARNRAEKSRLKTIRKNALDAITTGDKAAALAAYNQLASAADKASKSNLIHRNKAANLKRKAAKALATLA